MCNHEPLTRDEAIALGEILDYVSGHRKIAWLEGYGTEGERERGGVLRGFVDCSSEDVRDWTIRVTDWVTDYMMTVLDAMRLRANYLLTPVA